MTDLFATLAIVFGFALACVISVVFLLSKRQIYVTQNNSTSVTTTERTDSSTGGSGRVERFLIKWTFIVIVAGLVIATLANAVTTALSVSSPVSAAGREGVVTIATPAPMPTIAVPSVSSPVADGGGREGVVSINPLTIIIPILAGAAASIWGHITISVIKINRARRAASPSKREAQLEELLDQIETL